MLSSKLLWSVGRGGSGILVCILTSGKVESRGDARAGEPFNACASDVLQKQTRSAHPRALRDAMLP